MERTIPPHLEDEAADLVRLYSEHEPWVWKNPRATLWLEEWARRFPDALVVICLLIVGWQAFRQSGDEKIRTVDPADTIKAAAAQAAYPLEVPTGLSSGYRVTSAHTDAASARQGAPVTLQIGYLTPKGEYAGFVESDDPRSDALTSVLGGAQEKGTVDLGGASWTRETTSRGETALVRRSGDLTLVVSGSAGDGELGMVAAAVRPYSG